VRATFRGDPVPPDIEEWAPIVRDGALASAIVVAFALPPAILATSTDWSGDTALTLTGLVVVLVALVSTYVLPAALARFAHRDTLVAGLDCWTLLDVVLLPAYVRTWFGLAVVGTVLLGGVQVILSLVDGSGVPAVVWILATLLGYAVLVFGARAVALTYARIMRLEADANGVARQSMVDADS
jgi:hypothetical protein